MKSAVRSRLIRRAAAREAAAKKLIHPRPVRPLLFVCTAPAVTRVEQGRVNPLQTTFKTDSSGLGAGGKLRPRVTHFPSHVPSQALNAKDGKSDAVRAHEKLERRRRRGGGGGGQIQKDDRRKRFSEGGSGKRRRSAQEEALGSNGSRMPINGVEGDSAGVANVGRGFWGQGTHSTEPTSSGSGNTFRGSRPDTSTAGAETGRFLSRKDREAREQEKKRKDRRTRFELFSDVPEEFAALFGVD